MKQIMTLMLFLFSASGFAAQGPYRMLCKDFEGRTQFDGQVKTSLDLFELGAPINTFPDGILASTFNSDEVGKAFSLTENGVNSNDMFFVEERDSKSGNNVIGYEARISFQNPDGSQKMLTLKNFLYIANSGEDYWHASPEVNGVGDDQMQVISGRVIYWDKNKHSKEYEVLCRLQFL